MSDRAAAKLVEVAISTGVISEADREFYQYAYLLLIEYIISWSSIFTIALLTHQVLGALFFALFYIPLRIFAGGYHAREFRGCNLLSIISFTLFCLTVPLVTSIPQSTIYILIMICSVTIFALAPIADPNKPFEGNDENRNRFRTRIVLVTELIIAYFMCIITLNNGIYCFIAFSFLMVSLLLIVSAIKIKTKKRLG